MEADSHFLEFVSTLRLYYRSPPAAAAAPALEKFGTQGGAAGKKRVCALF